MRLAKFQAGRFPRLQSEGILFPLQTTKHLGEPIQKKAWNRRALLEGQSPFKP